jgi:antitoxin component YwqK of YwqJK toxin-antitoxin module
MAEQLLTGQPTPPTGPLPLTYQNLFTESTKVSQRKDVPLPDGKYATNAKELETFLRTPENQDAFYKMYSAPAMAFGARNLDQFKVKLSGGLTSGEIAMQKAKPSLPTVKPQTQVQQMEYQDLNQPAIDQFNELKANKINKTATGKPLNTYTEMQDYFSSPENVSEWGKAYNSTIKYRKLDLNQIANNAKPVQSLKTITEIQTDNVTKRIEEDLSQVDPKKLAELVYNAEELGLVGESIELQKPIEIAEIVDGELVVTGIKNLTYDRYIQLLKKKYGKIDETTEFFEPSVAGEPTVYEVNEFEQAKEKELSKIKENYLDFTAEKIQDENRSKIKNYDQDIETKMRQLLSPEEQQMAQVNGQIEALDDKMLTDKFSGKGIPADYYAKRNTLEQQLTSMRGKAGLGTAKMFDSRTGQFVETTPEQQQVMQLGAQKAQAGITKSTPKDQMKAQRNLLWEKVQLVDQQLTSVKNEWENQNIPGSTAIGMAQQALGIEGGMTGRSAQLYQTMLNLESKKADLYGQLLTYNSALATNEDVFQREKESALKAAGESLLEDTYGAALFTDKNTVRTRMQQVEDIKNFYAKNGYELSNKQILASQESLTTEVASGAGELLNLAIEIGVTSRLFTMAAGTLTGSKYWQATKELMSNKFGAYGRFATSMTEGALPYLTQGVTYSALGQNFATGVAESITEKGFDKYAAQGIEKFGGKYGKITFILGRWISGTLGEGAAEVMGEISPLLLENGFDVNAAYKQAFGETGDEQTKYFAKLGLTVAFMAAPANLGYVFKTKQKIQEHIANNGSNPVLEETMRVLDDTIERMPTGEAATRLDERIYGDNPVEPLVFVEAPSTIINEDAIEPPIQGPAERPLETVEVEKRSANNGEEFFVLENDGKVNKNVVYKVNETNGQLEVKGYDAMQEGWVPASKTITDAVDRKSKENGIISSDKASRVAKQRLNINPDAERVITAEGKVLYQTPGETAQQFGRNRQRNTNTVRVTADNTFAFLNGLKEKIITNIFPNAETKVDDQQSASYNKYRDAVRSKMKLNAGSFFSRGKAVLMESGMNKIPKVADFLAALVEDFSKTGKSIEITVDNIAQATTKTALKIEDVVNNIIATEFFQDKFGSMAEASDYAKNLLTDLMINDKSVAQEIFGQNKEAYNQFIKFREGFNKYVAKNYTGKTQGYSSDHKFYNSQMPEMSRRAGEEEFQLEQSKQIELEQKRDDVANVLNLAGIETSTQNVEGVRYKQGEINAEQYLDILGEDTNGLTSDEITAKADVASEGVNIDTFNEAVANRTINEQTRKKRETRLRKELRTKFGFSVSTARALAKIVETRSLRNISMREKRAVTAIMMNKVIETAATRAGVTADEFLDNYLEFQKSTEQEFSDFVKNQPGGKELYQRIGEMGAQYSQQVNDFLNTAKALEKEGKTADEILMRTGWSKAVTGDWKYTLVAPMSTLNVGKLTKVTQGNSESLPLGVLLDYPKLYEAYPQLKTYDVIFQNSPANEQYGTASEGIITINLANIPTLYQMNMVLQHELQHAVQRIEGWQMGSSPDRVNPASTLDVLNSIADNMREAGKPVSDLAVKEADRLMKEFGSQLTGASYNDFQGLIKLIQENLWDAVHPVFSDDLVKEFTAKFDMGLSNQVISLLEQASNDGLYVSMYGEIEARNAESRDFRAVNKLLSSLLIDETPLSLYAQPGKEETIKALIEEFNKINSDYKAFVETAKAALSEISQNGALTQRQRDILNGTFGTTQDTEFGKIDKSKIDSVPFDIILLYSELEKNQALSKEQLETVLNVIQIRSDYARTSASLKNKIVSNGRLTSEVTDADMLDGTNPLFYSEYGKTTVVPTKKYNPEAFRVTQKEWEAKRKELDDAANAVQDFNPTGEKFKENQDNAFDDEYLLSDNENDWRNGDFTSLYSIGNKRRREFEETLRKKRPDLENDGLIETALESIENFLEENTLPNKPNPKLEKLALYWTANGNIILPEDGYKVLEAIRIADAKKIDPFTFKNPTELINKYQAEVKEKKITIDEIDKMPEFTNKTKVAPEFGMNDFTDNIIIYTVEDTKEGQAAVRKIIDSHFGKDANPWCLAARVDGNLDNAWYYWLNRYNAYSKGIAFKNGKLVAFSANSDIDILWWDRNDEAHEGIEVTKELGDNKKQTVYVNENAETVEFGAITRETTTKDQQGNKIQIVETFNELGEVKLLERTKNGKLDGDQIQYYESLGTIFINESFKDGIRDGETTTYFPDGRVSRNEYFKNGKKEGSQKRYFLNGKLRSEERYKDGKEEGIQREYYEDGTTQLEQYYKNGKQEGIQKIYYENGQLEGEATYKNGKQDGSTKKYYSSGEIQRENNFTDGIKDGVQKTYYIDGTIEEENNYKFGRQDGVQKRYFEDGRVEYEVNYKDGLRHGIRRKYNANDNSYKEQEYKNGQLVLKIASDLESLKDLSLDELNNLLFQGNRGAAFITQDATDLIVALTDPNLSTPLHEIAHIYEKYMTDAEKKVVLDATGETSWSTNTSEYFARGFERYLYSGNAPSAKFLQIFDKLRTWLKEIYTELTGSEIDVQLNQPMRDLYAAMLGQVEAPETQVTAEEGPKTADRELADFIQSKKDQGIPEEQIYTGLLQSGFKAADLEDFFNLKTRQTVASQIEEEGPMKDEARIAADEAAGMYIRRTAEQLEMEMDSLTAEEAFTIIEHISQGNADVAISVAIQNILAKKALGENVQKEFDQLIEVGTNLGRALQAFTRLKNQSGALRARNIINKIEVKDKKKLPAVIKQKLIELGDKYDQAKLNFNNAKEAAIANPMGQSIISGKANIDYFQEKLKEFEKVGKEFSKLVAPYTSKTSITDTAMTIMRGNLLTPNSTVVNITANTAKTIFNFPINLIGSLGSAISSKVGGTKGTMRGWDYYTGAWNYKLKGFKKAYEIIKEGNVPDTSKGLQLDTNFNGFRSLYEIVGSIYAKIIDKKTDEEIAAEYGYSLNAMDQIPKKEMLIKTIEGTFGFPAEVFFRVLGAGDAVFRSTAYYSALTEQAKLAGLKDPKDIENFIILNSDYSNTKADNEALRFVYANNSRIYQGVSKIYGAGSDLPGKAWKLFATGVIPYAKIPTNVIIEFSEIMIPELSGSRAIYYAYELNKLAQKQKTTKNPQEKLRIEAEKQDLARKRDEMIGKAVVGTALTLTAATIAESGALSGGAQGEDRKRKDFQYRFERPYSINLSLLDRFINKGDSSGDWLPNDDIRDYRFMGILGGMLFAAEENRKEEARSGKGKAVNQSVYSIIGDFFGSRANNLGSTLAYLIDQSFLRGAAQFFGTLNPTQEGSGERFVSGLLSTYSTVIIPNFMAIYDKANRKYIPEYDSPYELWDKIRFDFMAKVNERIPGNENVTPKIDAFGRPIPQTPVGRNPWLYNSIDVTKSSTGLYDDEDQRWEQLVYHAVKKGDVLSAMPPHPSPYIKTLVGGEKYRLSQEEYEKYSIAMGEARRQIVNRFISTGNADKFIDLKSSLNAWPDGRPKTIDNEGHLMGYSMLGEILSSLYSAADATMINAERGIINEERKKMAIERPEEYQKLIEREKNNIYSNAINRLYDNPNVGKYLPKTTAMDIFFTKRVKYEPNNKTYQATGDETQQGQPVEQLTEEERRYREYIKQRDEKKNQPTEDKTQQPQPSSQPNNVQNKQITEEERRYREYLKQRDKK